LLKGLFVVRRVYVWLAIRNFFIVYFFFVYKLARFAFIQSKRKGSRDAVSRFNGFIVVALGVALVFWDAIPTLYIHYDLCKSEAGLKVNQTPGDWIAAHRMEFEEIRSNSNAGFKARKAVVEYAASEMIYRKEIAPGFIHEVRNYKDFNYAFNNRRHKESVVFKSTGQVLFEVVDFYGAAGGGSLGNDANSLADYKFWTVTGSCKLVSEAIAERFMNNGSSFSDLMKIVYGWSEK
jgi:hypothetical protein